MQNHESLIYIIISSYQKCLISLNLKKYFAMYAWFNIMMNFNYVADDLFWQQQESRPLFCNFVKLNPQNTSLLRPSEKFGTHSTILGILEGSYLNQQTLSILYTRKHVLIYLSVLVAIRTGDNFRFTSWKTSRSFAFHFTQISIT